MDNKELKSDACEQVFKLLERMSFVMRGQQLLCLKDIARC